MGSWRLAGVEHGIGELLQGPARPAVWSVRSATSRHGGPVLIGLSVLLLLLLVGGGVRATAHGRFRRHRGDADRRPRPSASLGCPADAGTNVGLVRRRRRVSYLGLVPGTLVPSALTSMQGDNLVLGLALLSFTAFCLSLAAARAHDRAVGVTREH